MIQVWWPLATWCCSFHPLNFSRLLSSLTAANLKMLVLFCSLSEGRGRMDKQRDCTSGVAGGLLLISRGIHLKIRCTGNLVYLRPPDESTLLGLP
jgi:hypothetical protein